MASKIGSGIIKKGLVLHLDAASQTNYTLTNVEVLVVAGGGGGGWDVGGGGGGGGVCYSKSYPITPGSAISVTVGNGGAGANANTGAGRAGSGGRAGANGDNSVFGAITAFGGGGGGGWSNVSGANGGSGGGQTPNSSDASYSATQTGGAYYVGYGNPGGISARPANQTNENNHSGGSGGGGAGGPGGGGINNGTWTLNSSLAGFGGPGLPFNISGTTKYYGGGGGSSSDNSIYSGIGGIGGGGSAEQSGEANTGGGGGSGGLPTNIGGTGGSGIVIVRYPGPQKATGGNTITSTGGYTIHTFTSSGTFTPLAAPANAGAVYGLQDLSGNGNTGTQSGGVTYSSANGGALNFDGSNDYVSGSNVSSLQLLNDFTISSWVKLGSGGSVSQGIFEKMSTTNNYNGYGITRQGGYFKFWTASNNSYAYTNSDITYSSGDNWYYVVGRRMSGNNRLFINSILQIDSQSPPLSDSGEIYTIGRYYSNVDGFYFVGNIAQVSIYNRALSATEITQNFNAQRGRFGL